MPDTLHVNLGERSYPILFAEDLAEEVRGFVADLSAASRRHVVITGALVLAAAVSGPLWWPRRAAPPPPPQPTLAQFVSLVAKNGSLTPRQLALGAVLGAIALGLMAGGQHKEEQPKG